VYVAPPINAFSGRLEHVRKTVAGNVNLKAFHRQLEAEPQKDGSPFVVSYSAARNYHFDREPPLSYIAQVVNVFGVRIEWLLEEDGPVTKAVAESQGEAAKRLRIAVYRAVRDECGPLMPIGLDGIHEMIMTVVPLLARSMREAGDEHGIDDNARYQAAGSSLGRAVAGQLQALGLDPSHWSEPVKAQYVLQAMAALLVPLGLEYDRAVVARRAERDAASKGKAKRARRVKRLP
jgi:hypothetical protein